jgi:hypothetical protein
MNSVYKRYFFITLIALVICIASQASTTLGIVREIDRANTYIAKNGNSDDFEYKQLGCMIIDGDSTQGRYLNYYPEDKEGLVPDFNYAGVRCSDNNANELYFVIAVLMTVLFYLYERSNATADFCAVLPIKKRSAFLVKLACVALVALSTYAINLWSIQQFNLRIDAIVQSCHTLGIDEISALNVNATGEPLRTLLEKASFFASLFLFAEMTTRAYLPPCLNVLAALGVTGSLSGIYQFCEYYLGFVPHIPFLGVSARYAYYGDNSVRLWISAGLAIVFTLWAWYLSGRGDISRRGSVFRFRWVERLALLCVVICAMFCGFELMYLAELVYNMSMGVAVFFMLMLGAVAYLVGKGLILMLGR